jgi:3-methyladenine DNA glycosylase AlkD
MDAISLKNEITAFCLNNADEAIVLKYARYFKEGREGYDAYGVTTELMLAKVSELISNDQVTLKLLFEAAPALLRSGKHEETLFILLLVEKQLKKLSAQNFEDISKWFEYGIINWALCDTLCIKIIPWFFLKKQLSLDRLSEWQDSTFRFQRRAVPVSLIKLLKSTDDYSPFFDLITPLMMDKERVVHQGLGWFLREAWKKQPDQTEKFLLLWKDHAARLIFQYATEKMGKEEKARFRKMKSGNLI